MHGVAERLGGERSRVIEETLNDFVKEGKINAWRFRLTDYEVFIGEEDARRVEAEILIKARKKLMR